MNFKKRVNGSWVDTPYYIHNTSTNIITTPADIYANDSNATVGLKGNMEQSGTPTPTTPIQPQSCGERTGNLLDKLQIVPATSNTTIEQVTNGVIVKNIVAGYGGKITLDVEQNTQYCLTFEKETISGNYKGFAIVFAGTSQSTQLARAEQTPSGSCTFNTGENTKVNIWFYIAGSAIGTIKYYNIMLNKGNDYLEYEPYGQYKIPILSNSQTTNVYLGEVETTRWIVKAEFSGNEDWRLVESSPTNRFFNISLSRNNFPISMTSSPSVSTHFNSIIFVSNGTIIRIYDNTGFFTTETDFKSYLAQQYAAGTPVTVWYVLATPETATINEPLMKIGDYADEVTNVSIPVTAGGDTISVGTTVQPSAVTATYKGWHPVTDVHEAENGQWD